MLIFSCLVYKKINIYIFSLSLSIGRKEIGIVTEEGKKEMRF